MQTDCSVCVDSCVQGLFYLCFAVLYVAGLKEYVCFLVLCLALSWVNVLYFSRGYQHMGIYSVMIQKVPDACGVPPPGNTAETCCLKAFVFVADNCL